MVAGDTALSANVVDDTLSDLGRVAPAMLAAVFVVIAIYLRALVAPAYLVLTSLLAVFASLGLTVYVLRCSVTTSRVLRDLHNGGLARLARL